MTLEPNLRKPDRAHLRREWDTVGENDLRIDREVAAEIGEALNADLSGLFILFNQVRKHHWALEGAESRPVREFLGNAADRLSEMTDDVAIRVVALGGVPVCGPMGIRQHAPMKMEDADLYDLRTSLADDLEGYATLAASMRDHVDLATAHGDEATAEILRDSLVTVEDDAHTLERYLGPDALSRSGASR